MEFCDARHAFTKAYRHFKKLGRRENEIDVNVNGDGENESDKSEQGAYFSTFICLWKNSVFMFYIYCCCEQSVEVSSFIFARKNKTCGRCPFIKVKYCTIRQKRNQAKLQEELCATIKVEQIRKISKEEDVSQRLKQQK